MIEQKYQNKLMQWKYRQGLFLILFLVACVAPFEPEIGKYENVLVVDGAVSNIPGTTFVILTKTSSYNERYRNPVNAARITLIDDLGNELRFLNTAGGVYHLPDSNYAGQIGRSYKIHIETADGEICESQFEELKEPIPLDRVKYEFIDGDNDNERGIRILVDIENMSNLNAYFYWEYRETWEFEVPYSSSLEPDSKVCYKTVKPPIFIINSTYDLVQNQLLNYPLYFIDNTTNRLYRKYSVLVTQHTLTEQCYVYYQDLKEVNEERGTLFDKAPLTLVGNMQNLANSDQAVLGNFQVSGAVTKRIFINHNEIADGLNVPSGYEDCEIQYVGEITEAAYMNTLLESGWIVMDRNFNPVRNDTIATLTKAKRCYDCKLNGTNIKPEFWDSE
jgi:hypothetical protein